MKNMFIGAFVGAGLVLALILGAQTSMEKAPKMPNVNVVVQHFDKEEQQPLAFSRALARV
jgi:hypothetical protein